MKKKIFFIMLLISVFLQPFSVFGEGINFADKSKISGDLQQNIENSEPTSTPPSQISSSQPSIFPPATPGSFLTETSVSFSSVPENIVIGDKLIFEAKVTNLAKPFQCYAQWYIDENPVNDFGNKNFEVTGETSSVFIHEVTLEYWDKGSILVSFELSYNESVFARVEKEVIIKNTAYPEEEIIRVFNTVQTVHVEAKLNQQATLYQDVNLGHKIGTVEKGTDVVCLNSKTNYSNKVALPDGRIGWVPVQTLNISTKNYTDKSDLPNLDKDIFVNGKGYESKTDYLVWISLKHQKVNVYLGHKGQWKIEMVFPCGTGKNATPTIRGVFRYSQLLHRWPFEHYYVGPVMIFSGNYAMHSVLMNYNGTTYDDTVGRPVSNGCVRLLPADIRWLVDYVPIDSTVVVY